MGKRSSAERAAAARNYGFSLITLGAVCQVAPYLGLQLKALGDRGDLTQITGGQC